MPLKRLQRLVPLLAAGPDVPWPDAKFSAAFSLDRQGTVVIVMRVEADLPLLCQRSLEPYLEPVERRSSLAVVESVADQDAVPDHYEPVLADSGRLALQDLVEDELLLALPEVPRNPDVAAVDRSTDAERESQRSGSPETGALGGDDRSNGANPTHRPFEGLADLLGSRKS